MTKDVELERLRALVKRQAVEIELLKKLDEINQETIKDLRGVKVTQRFNFKAA